MNDEMQDAMIKELLDGQGELKEGLRCLKDSVEAYKLGNDRYRPYLDGALKAQSTRHELMKTAIKFVIQWSVLGLLTYIVYILTNQRP